METRIIFHTDFNTGEVYDFSRLEEILEQLPDGKLKEKLLSDFSRSQRTLFRILRNTSQRLILGIKNNGEENGREVYWLNIGPDGRGLDSLSFYFGFCFDNGQRAENGPIKRDLNGGLVFHGCHKVFEEDKENFGRIKVREGLDPSDETLASISIHT